jgi:hypothetical protein
VYLCTSTPFNKWYVPSKANRSGSRSNLVAEIDGMGFSADQAVEQLKRHSDNLQAAIIAWSKKRKVS